MSEAIDTDQLVALTVTKVIIDTDPSGPKLFRITSTALGITWPFTVGINESSRDSRIKIPTIILVISIFPYITNHVRPKPLFGKQESLESRQESWNQTEIPKDSRITWIKIQSCGPLSLINGKSVTRTINT